MNKKFFSSVSLFAVLVAFFQSPQQADAVVLDASRGHEDGCDRPAGPPHSDGVTSDTGLVEAARYFGATTEYAHGVLGDAIESKGLLVRYNDGHRVVCDSVLAGTDRVFEDTSPRLVDIDRDGVNEVIAVTSHRRFGARLELYGYPGPDEDFQLIASTPYIGQSFRWLAPAGAADFDGDGLLDIAYVETPHLGKVLKIVSLKDGALVTIAEDAGYTNHRIGDSKIWGGVRECGDVPEIILADGNWQHIVAARLDNGAISSRNLVELASFGVFEQAMDCKHDPQGN